MFTPSQELKLMIGGKSYPIHLTQGASVVGSGEIIPAEKSNIDWVKVGYQKTTKGVQILTSFNDQDLKLESIGEPAQKTVEEHFKNENGITSSGTSSMTNPQLVYFRQKKHNRAMEVLEVDYITTIALPRRLRELKRGNTWLVPAEAEKPTDERYRSSN